MSKKYLFGLAIACLAIGACGEKENGVKNEEKPKVVTVSLGSKPKSLDPAMYNEIPSLSIVEQIYNTLFQIDENGKIAPELAESYEYITPTELVIKLKKCQVS